MVKNAIVLGLLLAVSVPAYAGPGKPNMGDSVIEVRDRTKPCVKSSNSQDQEIDEDSDEGRSSKTKRIASLKSDNPEGFWSSVKSSVMSVWKKIVEIFSF